MVDGTSHFQTLVLQELACGLKLMFGYVNDLQMATGGAYRQVLFPLFLKVVNMQSFLS